jgi:3-isopropylmalate/(R)-2-methylmalate dehydratase small subunit
VTPEVGRRLLDAVMRDPALEVTVDVDQRLVRAPAAGITAPFSIDDSARERLLGGLDDVELTLTHAAELEAFEERRAVWLPHVSA